MRPLIAQLRAQLAEILPDAGEIIAYKMPGFRLGRVIIAGYAALSKQCGLYVSPNAIAKHGSAIAAAGLKAMKTGVTLAPNRPIMEELVAKRVLTSRKELQPE